MSVAEAQAKIDSKEFLRWMAFNRLEPFGQQAEDIRFARLMALIANANRDPKRKPTPFSADDFMPDYDEGYVYVEPMSPEETLEIVRALAEGLGGKLIEYHD